MSKGIVLVFLLLSLLLTPGCSVFDAADNIKELQDKVNKLEESLIICNEKMDYLASENLDALKQELSDLKKEFQKIKEIAYSYEEMTK